MALNLDLEGAAGHLNIHPSKSSREEIEPALQAELDSIKAYTEAIEAITMPQERGVALGICSNLAQPYGAAVKRLFPSMDVMHWRAQSIQD